MHTVRFTFLTLCAALCLFTAAAQAQSNPSQQETDRYRAKPCRDPWINIAYERAGLGKPNGQGDSGECNPKYYKNARWNSYAELYAGVRRYRAGLMAKNIVTALVRAAGKRNEIRLAFQKNGRILAVAPEIMQAVSGVVPPEIANLIRDVADNDLVKAAMAVVVPKNNYSVMSGAQESVDIGDESYLLIK
jgi:hypothetical protein